MPDPVYPEASTGDTAVVVRDAGESPGVRLRLDGPCLRETLEKLERGTSGKPMNHAALLPIVDQAVELMGHVLRAYASGVAGGEVGADGSARASGVAPLAGDCPTGLLYGLIQSGKTAAMIVATAIAFDNGFRTVVVLTSNNVKLVQQTFRRFEALEGPIVVASIPGVHWQEDRQNIANRIASSGAVFVCAKFANHQRDLIAFLRDIAAAGTPALIFDDEGDQATPDTTLAARSQQRPRAPQQASTTYRLTVENDAPAEPGESVREVLPHNVFVQVTATPYALVLQNEDSPLRPRFTRMIEPGEGYHGGDAFFSNVNAAAAPPLVYIDPQEDQQLRNRRNPIPEGLSRSIAYFLLSAMARAESGEGFPAEGYKHLVHTSPRTAEHDHAAELIRQYTDTLADELERDPRIVAARPELLWAYDELRRTVQPPSLAHLLDGIRRKLLRRRVVVVNAQNDDTPFGNYFNFVVGGNILGRGLTIDDLLVTYYLRQAQTTQMDTMLQHARMYGYRGGSLPFARLFLPRQLALRFRAIHDTESALRELLREHDPTSPVPIAVINALRPTRPGILDTRRIGTFRPGQQVYPMEPTFEPELVVDSTNLVQQRLEALFGGAIRHHEYLEVPLDELLWLVDTIPVREDEPSDWDPATIGPVLRSIGDRYGGQGLLFVREFEREGPVLVNGAISGAEHATARQRARPVLFLMRESGERPPGRPNPWGGVPFWYPTLVFPPGMPNQVFNASR